MTAATSTRSRVWPLTAALAVLGALLWTVSGLLDPAPVSPWLVLAVAAGFGLAEIFVVHLHYREKAHTLSLSELPLVIALLFLPAPWLIVAHLVGAGTVLAFHRRQPMIKLAFNLSSFPVQDGIAVLLFAAVSSGAAPHSDLPVHTMVSAIVAATVASAVAMGAVFAAIALSGGQQTRADRIDTARFGLTASAVTASFAVGAAALAGTDGTAAVLLLLLPVVGFYLLHRDMAGDRADSKRAAYVARSSALLGGLGELTDGLREVLDQTRFAFAADVAAVCFFPSGEPDTAVLLRSGPGEAGRPLTIESGDGALRSWPAVEWSEAPRLFGTDDGYPTVTVDGVGVADGMLAPLRTGDGAWGFVVVGNRLSDVACFTEDDLVALERVSLTLASALAQAAALTSH